MTFILFCLRNGFWSTMLFLFEIALFLVGAGLAVKALVASSKRCHTDTKGVRRALLWAQLCAIAGLVAGWFALCSAWVDEVVPLLTGQVQVQTTTQGEAVATGAHAMLVPMTFAAISTFVIYAVANIVKRRLLTQREEV